MLDMPLSTIRIVGILTISRDEHNVAETRECTKAVIPQIVARGGRLPGIVRVKAVHISEYHYAGLKVVEVAHDMQLAVGRYV